MVSKIFVEVFVTLQLTYVALAANYFFADQSTWAEDHDERCGGEEQSPINIVTKDVMHNSALDIPFEWSENFYDPINLKCQNKGQTYQCGPDTGAADRTMWGGALEKAPFKLLQFHFHFGATSSHAGSEHRINGHQYPAEVHFVFTTEDSFNNDILVNYGALAVWGFFIDILPNSYPKKGIFGDLLDQIHDNLVNYEDEVTLTDVDLSEMIPLYDPYSMGRFFRYKGGLTTPPCAETVQWTVFKDPIYISEEQYLKFMGGRTYTTVTDMVNTFRRPQDLNGRLVFRTDFIEPDVVETTTKPPPSVDSKAALKSSFILLPISAAIAKLLSQ